MYLKLDNKTTLKPVLLEVHLDYEKPDNFSLVFSSQYQTKRPDRVNKMKEIIKETQSTSRSLELGKYEFGKLNTSGAYSALESFLKGGLDAAYQQVTAGQDQNVIVDGSGISVKGKSGASYIKLTNDMIALIDDGAKTSRMAMGRFHNTSTGQTYYGVLADVIGGTLIAGKNLHMECFSPSGEVTQFKFDGTGAFLNNSRMYLQSDKGGRIGLDPNTGFIAGTSSLFTVADTGVVHPSCLNDDGNLILDKDGFPQNTNVFIGIDGQAYFRGNIYANDGVFNGMLYAKGGEFTGTLKATTLDGKLVGSTNGAIEGVSLNIGDGAFTVDQQGNVVIQKGSISWGAVTGTGEIDNRIQNAQSTANNALSAASDAYDEASNVNSALAKLVAGKYSTPKSTFIDGTTVRAPTIESGTLTSAEIIGGNIYGMNIYAGKGAYTYANMSDDGFYIYQKDANPPKISIAVDKYGTTATIKLGAGDGTPIGDSFFLTKSAGLATMLYTDSQARQAGFKFLDGGNIEVVGNLSVKAVFA